MLRPNILNYFWSKAKRKCKSAWTVFWTYVEIWMSCNIFLYSLQGTVIWVYIKSVSVSKDIIEILINFLFFINEHLFLILKCPAWVVNVSFSFLYWRRRRKQLHRLDLNIYPQYRHKYGFFEHSCVIEMCNILTKQSFCLNSLLVLLQLSVSGTVLVSCISVALPGFIAIIYTA